jgi:hypothetical protein
VNYLAPSPRVHLPAAARGGVVALPPVREAENPGWRCVVTEAGGLEDAPGGWLVGTKAKYPHCPLDLPRSSRRSNYAVLASVPPSVAPNIA